MQTSRSTSSTFMQCNYLPSAWGCTHKTLQHRNTAVVPLKERSRRDLRMNSSGSNEASSTIRVKEFGFARGFSDHFLLGDHLGSGSFGTVNIAINKATRRKYAVKTVRKKFIGDVIEPNLARRIRHEVDIYNRLGRSLNVAHMYAAYEDNKAVDMVMELCTGGELWQRVRRGRYSERQAAYILREVLLTVAQCHAQGIVIRDVKPDNFLFLNPAEDAPLKMIDFGLAAYCQEGEYLKEKAGSFFYVAPEVLKQRYSFKADLWSTGIVAYELLTGRMPFKGEDGELLVPDLQHLNTKAGMPATKDINRAILIGDLDFSLPPWDTLNPGARELVQWLLTRDPEQRPSAEQALRHPWLAAQGADGGSCSGWALMAGEDSGFPAPSSAPLSDTLVQRLQRYGSYSKLKKVVLRKVAKYVADDPTKVQALQDAFKEVDPSGTGKVPYESVVQLLDSGRFDLSPVEIQNLLSSFRISDDGLVNYYDWLAALIDWQQVQCSPQWEAWVEKVFTYLDVEGSGYITTADLEAAFCGELDECPYPDAVPSVLREVGHYEAANKVSISLEELLQVMRDAANDRLELFESRCVQRVH